MGSMLDVRQRIIEVAERAEGLVGPSMAILCGLKGSDWENELYRPFRIVNGRSQGVSTCGLVAEGVWHAARIDIPATWRPYRPEREAEKAIARAVTFARANGAWVFAGQGFPQEGDYMVVGAGLRTHALTVIAFDGVTCESIDGGQVDHITGLQAVKRVFRTWATRDGRPYLGERGVVGWVSAERLPLVI